MKVFIIYLISVCAFSAPAVAEQKESFDSLLKQITGGSLEGVTDCSEAYKIGTESPSIGTVAAATEICQKATEKLCEKYLTTSSVDESTGDGRLVGQICQLQAARGSYLAVKSLLKTPNNK